MANAWNKKKFRCINIVILYFLILKVEKDNIKKIKKEKKTIRKIRSSWY